MIESSIKIKYRDFEYWKNDEMTYWLKFPSGFKTVVEASSEEILKQKIDSVIDK